MAAEHGIPFMELNATEYSKVEQAFQKISVSVLERLDKKEIPLDQVPRD